MFAVQVYSDGCELAVNEFLETNIDIIGGELEYKYLPSLVMLKLVFTAQMLLLIVFLVLPTSPSNSFSLSGGSLLRFD